MVQKTYSVQKNSVEIETEGPDVITKVRSSAPRWKSPRTPQYITSATVTIGAFSLGNVLGWSSPALVSIQKSGDFPDLVTADISWIGSLITIGAVAGAPLAGYCIEKVGRKNTLLISALPLVLGWLSLAMAAQISMLYIGRFLTGVGIGSLSLVAPVYLSEISQPEIRGCLGAIFQVVVKFGILFTYVTGCMLPYNYLAGACGVVPIFFFIFVAYLPESPRYLIATKQSDRATDALCWLRASDKKCPSKEVLQEIDEIQEAISRKQQQKLNYKELMSPSTLKPLMIVLGLMFFNQFCGGNAFGFYAVMIFEHTGVGLDSHVSGVVVGVFQTFATIIASLYVDKAGRRILLILSFVVMCLSLVTLGAFFHLQSIDAIFHEAVNWIPLVSLVLFNAAYCGGVASLVWTVMSEVLPSNIIGFASGLTTTFNWSLAFLITRFFHDLNSALGPQNTFWLFAIFCAFGVMFIYIFVPETKGKSLDKIQQEHFESKSNTNPSPTSSSGTSSTTSSTADLVI
ncbi:unnamed protein product [Orchesella dallaii]|uniref:Major facilitator superfamily (MFS) profile domain-containing protein n=1 Tax=Orchesella dallaii TaxID=48710 RepID=A0ABP1QRY1_9HEXA